ncbi:MAG: tryptophan--tRNA ligase [Actinobacteria bacterium]|nr:tryptophan--tRNA ligase [Actinomycetota bacterium]
MLSGIQPTADSFHLGNYLGALRQWVRLQEDHEAFYAIVDLHAITVPVDPEVLRRRTRASLAQLLALDVDPERSVLFVQSQVPEHAQAAWVLQCLTGFGEASRMTQFKDKSAKEGSGNASVGLFTYPVLQAADILIYSADKVPVGEDQRQHLELTRDLAQRFNNRFGDTFTVPEPFILKSAARVADLQNPTAKMSKSSPPGCLELLDDPAVLAKKVKRAVTDSVGAVAYDPIEQPGVANLLEIIAGLTGDPVTDVTARFAGSGYGPLKTEAAELVVAFAQPFAVRTRELLADPAELDRIMDRGAERAREATRPKVAEMYERVGLRIPL